MKTAAGSRPRTLHVRIRTKFMDPRGRAMARQLMQLGSCSALSALLISGTVYANCAAPDRPLVEETEMSKRLNSYAEGAYFCVAAKTTYCPECAPGWWHRCTNGQWVAEYARQCPDPSSNAPSTGSGAAGFLRLGNPNSSSPNSPVPTPPRNSGSNQGPSDTSGDLPPIRGACRITNSC